MPTSAQSEFLTKLFLFINQTEAGPNFRGKTQAIRTLRRLANLSALKG